MGMGDLKLRIEMLHGRGCQNYQSNYKQAIHRLLVAILNTKISRVVKTLVFGRVSILGSGLTSTFKLLMQL